MTRIIVLILITFLLIINVKGQRTESKDSIQVIDLILLVNNQELDSIPEEELSQNFCITLKIDTSYVCKNVDTYIQQKINLYKKNTNWFKRKRKMIESITDASRIKYNSLLRIEDYQENKPIKIEGFSISGKSCFIKKATSVSNCINESQKNYLKCQESGDRIWVHEIKVTYLDKVLSVDAKVIYIK
jgi:hypothetical protein